MKNVCLDARALQSGHARRGIGVFVSCYLKAIKDIYPYEQRPKILLQQKLPLLRDLYLRSEFSVVDVGYSSSTFWLFNQFYLSVILKQSNINVFHALSPLTTEEWISLPALNFNISVLVTLHDLNLLRFADRYESVKKLVNSLRFKYQVSSLRNTKLIVVNSEFVKKDLVENLKINESQVTTIYPGNPHIDSDLVSLSKKIINGNYVMFVGEGRSKNLITCLRAVTRINKEIKLVVVARKKSCKEDVVNLCETENLKHRVIFMENIDQETLVDLYKKAICLVFPSYGEGFGFPIIEAMYHRCPVICSNVTSMPEISGGAAMLVEPDDDANIANCINLIWKNKELRKYHIELGKIRANKFSWSDMVRKYKTIYENLSKKDSLDI